MAREYFLNVSPAVKKRFQVQRQQWSKSDNVVAHLSAFAAGILADGAVNEAEATALRGLLRKHQTDIERIGWPLKSLTDRVEFIFEDGILTPDELNELATLLKAFCVDAENGRSEEKDQPSALTPLDEPQPAITFKGKEFVLTGKFAFGQKSLVAAEIIERGGEISINTRISTNYVVVGSFCSEGWKYGDFGTKVELAMELRERGLPIAIVSEESWSSALMSKLW